MREIKFRAWDKTNKVMHNWDDLLQLMDLVDVFQDEDLILMQFTNRKDKNKEEVYDRDILKTPGNQRMLVEIDNLIDGDGKFRSILIEECEIIGTELMEQNNGCK